MLQELRVTNLALIDTLELDFSKRRTGLIVFTGETGAGKSIILQAVHLLNGGRGSADWIRSGHDEAKIEALFEVSPAQTEVDELLTEQGINEGEGLIVRRVLNRTGRNRVYVNDRLVTSRLAGDLVENLVNIASQHDQQQLLSTMRHLTFLDSYGELWGMRSQFGKLFRSWQQLSSSLRQLQEKEQDKEQRRDFLQYQLNEIRSAAVVRGEDERLIKEREVLKASATLAELAGRSCELLEKTIVDPLAEVRKQLDQAAEIDPKLNALAERMTTASFEAQDCAVSLRSYLDRLPEDSTRIETINERLAELKQLQRKYGPTLEEVLAYAGAAKDELAALESMEQEIQRLELELEEVSTEAMMKATELSTARREVAGKLAAAMESELASLGFLQARFEVDISCPEGMGMDGIQASGRDKVEFLFSANPGEPAKPLAKVVSGGELSRLMLAMKCLLAKRDLVETVIFDEVDAGIGGQAAESVAAKIRELADHHQVFCITHLPQIAVRGDSHYLVTKQVENNRTCTTISALEQEERIEEVARMLGGTDPSAQTRTYAAELLARARTGTGA